MTHEYYVYVFCDPCKPGRFEYKGLQYIFDYEPFYVGKGKDGRINKHFSQRELDSERDNPHKCRIIKKIIAANFDPKQYTIKIYEGLSEIEAYKLESSLIILIGRYNLGTGSLVNCTNGCDGPNTGLPSPSKGKTYEEIYGYEKAQQMKQIRSNRFKGERNPMFGKESWSKGKHLSAVTKQKLSDINSVPIIQLDLNNNIIKEWKSIREAEKGLNLLHTAIGNCLKGRSKTSGGFKWQYKENI